MGRKLLGLVLSLALFFCAGCVATNRGGLQSQPVNANIVSTVVPTDGSFLISLGQTRTAFLQKTGKDYKLVRVENGRQKGKYAVVFNYHAEGDMQFLTVMHHLSDQFITYDCYQVKGHSMHQTSITFAIRDVPSNETWSDGIKTLLIENIRPLKPGKKAKKERKAQKKELKASRVL